MKNKVKLHKPYRLIYFIQYIRDYDRIEKYKAMEINFIEKSSEKWDWEEMGTTIGQWTPLL